MGSISRDTTFKFAFASICKKEETITGKTTDFIPEVEDKVIMEAVSHKLDRPLANPPNKVWRDSTQTKNPTSPLQICDSIRYTNEEHNEMLELMDITPMILTELSKKLSY